MIGAGALVKRDTAPGEVYSAEATHRAARSQRSGRCPAVKRCLSCDARFESPPGRARSAPGLRRENGVPLFAPALAESGEHFPREDVERLAALEADSLLVHGPQRPDLLGRSRRYFPDASSLLEIGCGTGVVLARLRADLPQLRSDGRRSPTRRRSTVARDRIPDATFAQIDIRHLPFADEFDVVCALDVLEHVDEDSMRSRRSPGAFAREAGSSSRCRSTLALERRGRVRPAPPPLRDEGSSTCSSEPASTSCGRPRRCRSSCRSSRFSRCPQPALTDDYDPFREFVIPQRVNRALGAVMSAERRSHPQRGLLPPRKLFARGGKTPMNDGHGAHRLQPRSRHGRRVRLHARGDRERPPGEQRALLEAAARTGSRSEPEPARAPDPLVHRRARDGVHARGDRPGRRGDHAVVHVRHDGERRRRARRTSGVRRRPPGHALPRRAADRGRHHAADEGDRAGPLRRRRLRDGRDRRSSPSSHDLARRSRTPRRASARRVGPPARRDRTPRRAQLPRDEERQLRRGRRAARQRRRLVERAEIVHEKGTDRAPLLPRAGRQVHVGRRRLLVRAERARGRVPVGAAPARARITATRLEIWDRYHAAFEELEQEGRVRRPVVPGTAAQRAHVLPPPRRPRDANGSSSTACASVACTRSSTTSRSTRRAPGERYGRATATSTSRPT